MLLTLTDKKEEAPNVTSFIFEPETPVGWLAGQYMRYHLEDLKPDERGANRFFTISSAPHEDHIMLTTKFTPEGSTFKKDLQKLAVGDKVEATGPSGSFVVEDPDKNYVFIAGGIGITPFRSILLDLDFNNKPVNVTLLYANRDGNIVFKDKLEYLAQKHPTFKVHYFIDPQRIDAKALKSLSANLKSPIFLVSGPKPMVEAMEVTLKELGVPVENIRHDYFPGYQKI